MYKAGFQGIQSSVNKSLRPRDMNIECPPKTKMNHVLTCIWTNSAVLGSIEISSAEAMVFCYHNCSNVL